MKNYLEKNKVSLTKAEDLLEYERRKTLLTDEEYCTDMSVMVEQFTHYLNLFSIFGQEKINEYCKFLRKKGINQSIINVVKNKAVSLSQWSKPSFITNEIISKGKKLYNIKNKRS